MSSSAQFLNPSAAARRLGVSAKALRLYEQRGLVAPSRTPAGWRAYGPDEILYVLLLAGAAGTDAQHVLVTATHVHDAPVMDEDAEKLLREMEGINGSGSTSWIRSEEMDRSILEALRRLALS